MNGFDGEAREAFKALSDALESCRSVLRDRYNELSGFELKANGEALLEKIDSVSCAIRALGAVNSYMEDAGIE